jgi:hypothetical protein
MAKKTNTPAVVTGSSSNGGAGPTTVADSTPPPFSLPVGEMVTLIQSGVTAIQQAAQETPGLVLIENKRGTLKPRPGSLVLINDMAVAAQTYPTLLGSEVDPQELKDTLTYLLALAVLQTQVEALAKATADTVFVRTSGAWKVALGIYAALSAQTQRHPELVPVLAPMKAYLALGPRKEKPKSGSADTEAGSTAGDSSTAPSGTAASSTTGSSTAAPPPTNTVPVYTPGGNGVPTGTAPSVTGNSGVGPTSK